MPDRPERLLEQVAALAADLGPALAPVGQTELLRSITAAARELFEVPWLGGSTIRATGNSFAAPHIAGLVARILGKHPSLTPFQVKTILLSLASNAAPPGGPDGDRHLLLR